MLQQRSLAPRADHTVRAGRWRALVSWSLLGAFVALVAFLWPVQWGGSTSLTIVSGHSMDGTYSTGDLVIGRKGPVEVGDVIVFKPEGLDGHVVHRVIGGDATSGWTTQGDNNDWVDPFEPTHDVVGVVHGRIPHAWLLVRFVTSPFAIVALGLVVLGVYVWPDRDADDEDDIPADAAAAQSHP